MLELDWSKWDKASGKDNQPINPSAVGKKDDANPNFQFREHFPNSLNVSFQASVINSEASVRQGVARCYSFLERAIELGEKLEILNPETVILLKSLSVLAGSSSKFFERLPESIVGAIAYIKNEGIQHFIEHTPNENLFTALVCQVAHQLSPEIESKPTTTDPIEPKDKEARVKEAMLDEFIIKAQLLYNGMVASKVKEYKFRAVMNESEISSLGKDKTKLLARNAELAEKEEDLLKKDLAEISQNRRAIIKIDYEVSILQKEVELYDKNREELEDRQLKMFQKEDRLERAKDLACVMGDLLTTRVTVEVAKEFGLISSLHALCIESIWDPAKRTDETESLGNRLRIIDQELSKLYPLPAEPPHHEDDSADLQAAFLEIHQEREAITAKRIEFEKKLWAHRDYRKMFIGLSEEIGNSAIRLDLKSFKVETGTSETSAPAEATPIKISAA